MTNTFKIPKTILVHGPSGSGKDTQVDLLAGKFKIEKIGTGEMFREIMKENQEIEKMINAGQFIPSKMTYELLNKWMDNYGEEKNWVFVSVVRTFDQVELFDELLKKYNRELELFVHFSLSEEKSIERMALRKTCSLCGENYHDKYKPEKKENVCDKDGAGLIRRDDDKPESIKRRLEEYNKSVEPILEEYKNRGILVDIDASFTIEEIHEEVLKKLSV